MKNGFVITSLVIVAGCSGAFAAEALGVLPSSVVSIASFPSFVGWFAAAGVLALGIRDYACPATYDAKRKRTPRIEAARPARSAATADTAWVHHTVSA